MEIQHCEMRWNLPPDVLQGLPKAWEHGHNPPLACGKQHKLPAVGIPLDIPPGQPQPATTSQRLICWHRFPRELKEGTNILPQCAGISHLEPYPWSLAGGAQAQRCWRRTDCAP